MDESQLQPTAEQQAAAHSARVLEGLCDRLAAGYDERCRSGDARTSVVLVLGAAASAPSQFPAWNEALKERLVQQLCELLTEPVFLDEAWMELSPHLKLGNDEAPAERRKKILLELASIEQICGVAANFRVADRRIREVFSGWFTMHGAWTRSRGPGPPPLLIYELIAHWMKHGIVNHIITFNFDELLETALENELGADGFRRVFSGYEPVEIHQQPMPTLVKIHGTVSSPETMRFTYLDVAVLTRQMRAHLECVLDLKPDPERRRSSRKPLELFSLGYSWRDRNFAHWLEGKLVTGDRVTVVRQTSALRRPKASPNRASGRARRGAKGLQSILPRYLQSWIVGGARLCEGVSTTDLDPDGHSGSVSLDDLCWVITEQVLERARRHTPVQPVARHLLLGNLFRPADATRDTVELLRKRTRAEIVLHLAKSKGFINTGSAPTLPRVKRLITQLRLAMGGRVTANDFLFQLYLDRLMVRSSRPEAWDTYFAAARTRKEFLDSLTAELIRDFDASTPTRVPKLSCDHIIGTPLPLVDFVRQHLEAIVDSSDVEILTRPSPEVDWSFVHPKALPSFGAFAQRIVDLMQDDWTHLVAITESLRWLGYPWMAQALGGLDGRKVVAILPSGAGLEDWHLRSEFLDRNPLAGGAIDVRCARIPWWHHNRHVILGIRLTAGRPGFLGGVYYTRPLRNTGIAPVAVEDPRDQAKLFGVLLRYCRRFERPEDVDPEFVTEVKALVGGLLANPVFTPGMKEYVSELYAAVRWPDREAEPPTGALVAEPSPAPT